MTVTIGVYGASGFGREVMPLVAQTAPVGAVLIFIDDGLGAGECNGYPVHDFAAFAALSGEKRVCIAIADSHLRERLMERCDAAGIPPFDVMAPNATIGQGNRIGSGSILCGFSMVTSNAVIGRGFHTNIYSYVAHDCVVGDFVTFAPAVKCNGNVHIGDHAYIGTGAILKQGTPDKPLRIGAGAVVGMGAVVTKDVPDGVTVVGNPARPLDRKG
jgi:hypothetical protein